MVQIVLEIALQQDAESFARAAVHFLKHYELDGVDLPWTSPSKNTEIFDRLLRILKNAFTSENYTLSVLVSADPITIESMYQLIIKHFKIIYFIYFFMKIMTLHC